MSTPNPADIVNGETVIDYAPVYDRLFPRARAYNHEHREPGLRLDVCGYEYSTIKEGELFDCIGCDFPGEAREQQTVKVEVTYYDPDAALGRRQQRLGIACCERCAHRAFGIWYWERRV